jgi:hypothetical protein
VCVSFESGDDTSQPLHKAEPVRYNDADVGLHGEECVCVCVCMLCYAVCVCVCVSHVMLCCSAMQCLLLMHTHTHTHTHTVHSLVKSADQLARLPSLAPGTKNRYAYVRACVYMLVLVCVCMCVYM